MPKPTRAPQIDPLRLDDLRPGDAAELGPQRTVEGLRFVDAEVEGRDLSGATFSECELVGWNAHEASFRAARFLETRIERLNAPVLSAARSTFRDVRIEGSRIGSAELYDAELHSLVVEQSKLGWVNLRAAQLRDVRFRGCTFDELDLGEATLARVAFEDCTVGELVVTRTTMQDVDLRGLDIRAIRSLEGLAGATIDSQQAAALAEHFAAQLGLRIEDR
ncbi:pentapeptide repeat-containing protein [Agromyces sp. NPDC060279]|uniref:pentapeptide repeat-containing protein n=1 Tax=Agromyces sp. NPDC060279 TaxID=3347092 RepID=UPI00364CD6D6